MTTSHPQPPHRSRYWLRRLAGALPAPAALLVWEAGARASGLLYFPPPTTIAARAYHLWFSGPPAHAFLTPEATEDLLPSLTRLVVGWTLATALGLAAGLALGRLPILAALADPLLHIGRAIPPPAMLPLFLATLPIGTPTQLATILAGVIWPVLINTADGVRHVHHAYLDTANAFRLGRARRLLYVIVPAAAAKILAGLRLSVSLALIMMVVSELTASTDGLGYRLQEAAGTVDVPAMWAVIVLLGLAGIAANRVFLLIQRRLLRSGQDARPRGHVLAPQQ